MAWDDTIAEAITKNTRALNRLAAAIEKMGTQWEPVIAGLLEEQEDEREQLAKRTSATRLGADSRKRTRTRRLCLPVWPSA